MDLPKGRCVHSIAGRLRIKIEQRRQDQGYFEHLRQILQASYPQASISTNPLSATILCQGRDIALGPLAQLAREQGLFKLVGPKDQVPLAGRVEESFQRANKRIREYTRDELDLPSIIFFYLIGTAAYQIIRGNLAVPPWHTAFWYAFGVFSKSLINSGAAHEPGSQDQGE